MVQQTNYLRVFDHFAGFAPKGLTDFFMGFTGLFITFLEEAIPSVVSYVKDKVTMNLRLFILKVLFHLFRIVILQLPCFQKNRYL